MVEGKEALKEFLTGGRTDGVAYSVVFRKRFDFVEIVSECEILPMIWVGTATSASTRRSCSSPTAGM